MVGFEGVGLTACSGFWVVATGFLLAGLVGCTCCAGLTDCAGCADCVVSSGASSVSSPMMLSIAASVSGGTVVSSLLFGLQPQKRNIVAHRMSATAEISFLFIVFSFLSFRD